MDIELTYKNEEIEKITDYTDVTINPNFSSSQVIITFKQLTTNYDDLYNDMKNSPIDFKIKFSVFGADTEYLDLKIVNAIYRKTLLDNFTETHDISVTLAKNN